MPSAVHVFGSPATDEQMRAEFEALKQTHDRLGNEMKQCELELLALLRKKYDRSAPGAKR